MCFRPISWRALASQTCVSHSRRIGALARTRAGRTQRLLTLASPELPWPVHHAYAARKRALLYSGEAHVPMGKLDTAGLHTPLQGRPPKYDAPRDGNGVRAHSRSAARRLPTCTLASGALAAALARNYCTGRPTPRAALLPGPDGHEDDDGGDDEKNDERAAHPLASVLAQLLRRSQALLALRDVLLRTPHLRARAARVMPCPFTCQAATQSTSQHAGARTHGQHPVSGTIP